MRKTKLLTEKWETELFPLAPFNFDATVFKPSHFPTPDHIWQKEKYWQTMRINGKIVGFKMENKGRIKNPKVKLVLYAQGGLDKQEKKEAIGQIRFQFGFNEDLGKFYQKYKNDKILAPSILRLWGMRVNSGEIGLYTMLMVYIVLQNATVRRTTQMMNALLAKYGDKVGFAGKKMYVFWTPEMMNKATEKELRSLKVGYRARFFKKISEVFVGGKFDEKKIRKLQTEKIREKLLKLYGIGPASVGYLLFEVFHRYEFLNTIPPWDQKIYSRILYNRKLVPVKKILKDVEKWWGKWKRLALHYLWEDLFWRHQKKPIGWLEKEIRL